jgi:glutamyl-tRNA synthetase
MPLLRNKDRSKISKRKNPTSLIWYKQSGYLPEALLNFLGLMGYSHAEGKEVFDLATMLAEFDVSRITASGPVFDLEKLGWLNGEYVRRLGPDDLAARLLAHFRYRQESGATEEADVPLLAWVAASGGFEAPGVLDFVRATIPLVQERIKTLQEYAALASCFFRADVSGYDGKGLVPKGHAASDTLDALAKARARVGGLPDFAPAPLEAALRTLADEIGWKPKDLFQPLRLAVTGSAISPPLFETLLGG